ncbi:MAG TPA: hypothetical protein VGE07_07960 [Herpetosiphonaceae bacterium]
MTDENRAEGLSLLSANPHLYDYMHYMDFDDDGSVKMIDGAGQRINAVAEGRYRHRQPSDDLIEIEFFELRELNPRDRAEIRRTFEPFVATARIERGPFAIREQVVWNVSDENALRCRLYDRRYVFDTDPLAFAEEPQRRSLYYEVHTEAERAALIAAARIYYPRSGRQDLTLGELRARGIEPA